MLTQASLPDEETPLPLQVEANQAALPKDVALQRTRFLWTALGFAVLMLIGVSACALHPFASNASASAEPSHLVPDVASFHLVPDVAHVSRVHHGQAVSPNRMSPVGPRMQAQSQQATTRRGALAAAGAVLAVRALPASAAIQDPINMLSLKNPSAAAKEVLSTQELLNAFVKSEEAFVMGQVDNDASAPQLPRAIPFTTFQSLEKDAGPEFMEIAIDYAEAMRNARDLNKLAKLTKQKVTVSSKEPGKPRINMEIEYGAAEGSSLGSTKEYATRAFQEAIGANVALNAVVDALPKKK